MALQRWRGDESLRLLREMADIAERGGEARLAAGAYARAVEVVSRMGGITGDLPEEELQAMLDRGRALVPDDDKVTRARLLLDEAWMAWRSRATRRWPSPARAGLELARQTEDIPVLSSALDAVAALRLDRGTATGWRWSTPGNASSCSPGCEGERTRSRSSAATPST